MGDETKIEWCDHTFNPWIGCTKVSAGCTHCYAETLMDKRYGKVQWGANGTRVKTSDANWRKPLAWNRQAEKDGVRRRVFCASLADVFEDWGGPVGDSKSIQLWHRNGGGYRNAGNPKTDKPCAIDDLRRDLFALIDQTPWLDWLLLTKRPENIRCMWPHDPAGAKPIFPGAPGALGKPAPCFRQKPRSNVWLGTSVENQEQADKRIPELLKCGNLAPVLWLSAEPLLGPIDLCRCLPSTDGFVATDNGPWHVADGAPSVQWVVIGSESGRDRRPMELAWARDIQRQCFDAGVAVFQKQMEIDGAVTGEFAQFPSDLQIRQWPETKVIA